MGPSPRQYVQHMPIYITILCDYGMFQVCASGYLFA